jgi:hypothetical protein
MATAGYLRTGSRDAPDVQTAGESVGVLCRHLRGAVPRDEVQPLSLLIESIDAVWTVHRRLVV